jgi:hypothetical protein
MGFTKKKAKDFLLDCTNPMIRNLPQPDLQICDDPNDTARELTTNDLLRIGASFSA